MIYFFLCLVISLTISVGLGLLLLKAVRRNKAKANTLKFSYFSPLLLAVLLCLFLVFDLQARLLDVTEIFSNNLATVNLEAMEFTQEGQILQSQKRNYRLSPWQEPLNPEKFYHLKLAPNTKIVMEVEEVSTPEETISK